MDIGRTLCLSIFLALLLPPALAQNSTSAVTTSGPNELIGEYIYSSGFVGASYKISADETYEYMTFSDCCDPVWRESGSYALKENLLHLKIATKTLNGYDMLDARQAAEAYRKIYDRQGVDVQAGDIKTEYVLQVVRWGGRVYLLEPERISLFAAAVNFGVEPRQHMIGRNYLTSKFFLRRGDEHKAVAGKPMLPEPWSTYLNDSPIEVAVTRIESNKKGKIYLVNQGSADGVKVGMFFVGADTEPDYDHILRVISVEEGSATLGSLPVFRAEKYQVGNSLVSKTVMRPR